jgi:hypothetical protein
MWTLVDERNDEEEPTELHSLDLLRDLGCANFLPSDQKILRNL